MIKQLSIIVVAVMAVVLCSAQGQKVDPKSAWLAEGKRLFPRLSCTEDVPRMETGFVEVHVSLTPEEAEEWSRMEKQLDAMFEESEALEKRLIAAHGITELRDCGESLGIRSWQNFIFDSVPDNPNWPGFLGKRPNGECGRLLKAKRLKASRDMGPPYPQK